MNRTCPKCGKLGKFGFFDAPDKEGTHGVFTHKTGNFKKIKDAFSHERIVEETIHHFVTLKELKSTDWFGEFIEEREKYLEQRKKEMNKYWNNMYIEDWKREKENELEKD